MIDYAALNAELTGDPLARGYAGMDDQQAADDINSVYRDIPRAAMNGDEVFAATNAGEFGALTEHKQAMWLSFCARDQIDPYGTTNEAFVDWVYGGGSTTRSTLASLRTRQGSRAEELGLPAVRAGDVEFARTL